MPHAVTRRSAILSAAVLPQLRGASWDSIAHSFPVDRRIANFNHAGVGTCATQVLDALVKRTRAGEERAPDTIFSYGPQLEPVRRDLAALLGCDSEEVAIVRNATEALHAVLLGIPLRAGDEVVTTTLDYWAMLDALEQRRQRDGVVVRKVRIPVPCEDLSQIVARFAEAMTPRTRLLLVSHPVNLNGQLFPVRELAGLAHANGAEIVVDAAQSFALVDYKVQDLQCDYLGTSLHKWLQAPKGTGMLFVKRDKIGKVWPLFASGVTRSREDIRKFELYGTWPDTILGIADALAFHQAVGGTASKQRRHSEMAAQWRKAVEGTAGLRFHTSARQSCGITCLEVENVAGAALREWLLRQRRILTMDVTRRTREFNGVRISAGLPTTQAELDQLVDALRAAPNALKNTGKAG